MVPDDLDRARFLFSEAKDHLEATVEVLGETSDRAESVIRFNVLVIGLLVTATSVLVRATPGAPGVPSPILAGVGAGFAAMVVSTVYAALAYLPRAFALGLDAEDLVSAHEAGTPLPALLAAALASYQRGILRNEAAMTVAGRRFERAMTALIAGILAWAGAAVALLWWGVN